jgi:hypothetical protein
VLVKKKMHARNYPLHATLKPAFSFVCNAKLMFPLGLQFLLLHSKGAMDKDLLCQKNASMRDARGGIAVSYNGNPSA